MKAKPWQIALVVIGLLVGVGSALLTVSKNSGPSFETSLNMIDVETGDWLYIPDLTKGGVVIPARRENSETGKLAIVSLTKNAQGKWVVAERDRQFFKDIEVPFKAVDRETGDVLVELKERKRFK